MIGVAVIVMIFGCKFIIVCGRECCFALKVRDFWVVQCFVAYQCEEQIATMVYVFPSLKMVMCRFSEKSIVW